MPNAEEVRFYKARGICPVCGKNRAAPGHVQCADCLYKQVLRDMRRDREKDNQRRKELRAQRKAEGRCQSCGARPAEPGKTLCKRCLLTRRQRMAATYVRVVKPDTECLRCALPRMPGKKYCPEHQAEAVARAAHMRSFCKRENHPWGSKRNAKT